MKGDESFSQDGEVVEGFQDRLKNIKHGIPASGGAGMWVPGAPSDRGGASPRKSFKTFKKEKLDANPATFGKRNPPEAWPPAKKKRSAAWHDYFERDLKN